METFFTLYYSLVSVEYNSIKNLVFIINKFSKKRVKCQYIPIQMHPTEFSVNAADLDKVVGSRNLSEIYLML